MGYSIQDNEVFRPWLGDSSSSTDEEDDDEEENAKESQDEDDTREAPNEAAAHTDEPHPEPMETEPLHWGRGASYSVEFESRMEQRMDNFDSQFQSMQSDIRNLT